MAADHGEFAPPEVWPPNVRAEREREHIEAILALPMWTLFRAGWLTPSGHVQGSTYYRVGGGCGPTSRDTDARQVLAVAARDTCYTTQPWAIEVLAEALPEPRVTARTDREGFPCPSCGHLLSAYDWCPSCLTHQPPLSDSRAGRPPTPQERAAKANRDWMEAEDA